MTDLSTSNLKRLLDEVTPGPWEVRANYEDGDPRPDTSCQIFSADEKYLGIVHSPHADLAAAAPELAQEVLRMREELIAWANDEAQAHNAILRQAKEAGSVGIISAHVTIYNRIREILGDQDG